MTEDVEFRQGRSIGSPLLLTFPGDAEGVHVSSWTRWIEIAGASRGFVITGVMQV